MTLYLSRDPDADQLLSRDPLALLIGMVLDQQIPLERAFKSPSDLRERLGVELDAGAIAAMDPETLASVFSTPPALHRFPGSMAARVQALCSVVVSDYGGRAEDVWAGAETGAELLRRVNALPGFGEQKARIFVALLAKQLAVTPPGWEEAAGPFGTPGSYLSVADIVDAESLTRVREHKSAMKAAAKAAAPAARAGAGAKPGSRAGAGAGAGA
ncbi:MAG: HhH-GPD-type base excision DNA repair protein, partial [Acidimicrobiales bacterium]